MLLGGSSNGVDSGDRYHPDRLPAGTRETTRARYGIPDDALVVGFIGRVVRDKGIVELAEAWRSVRERFPEARLLIVGPLEPQDPLPAGVEDALRADAQVVLAGEDFDTPPLYAAMDVFALPTYREGFPNVLLEAAAMRLPVVATRVPGCTDAVEDGTTGLLVPDHDGPALAEALTRYLADPELRATHGAAARARVERSFRRDMIWSALEAEYLSLLVSRGLPLPAPVALTPAATVHALPAQTPA